MNIGFPVQETIQQRYSVRTYDPKPVDETIRQDILAYANTLTNPLGPHTHFQFIDAATSDQGQKLGTYGFIKGASLFLGSTIPDEPGALEALGYEFEQLILYMTSLGLGTCWLGGTFNRSAFARAMEIREGDLFPILSPVGYPAIKKRIGEDFFRRALKANQRKPWEKLFFANDFSSPLTKKASGPYQYPLEMLRLAPSAVNLQPWRVLLKDGSYHFLLHRTTSEPSGAVDMQRIDLGIAICHFHLAALESGLAGHFERLSFATDVLPKNTSYIISWIPE